MLIKSDNADLTPREVKLYESRENSINKLLNDGNNL